GRIPEGPRALRNAPAILPGQARPLRGRLEAIAGPRASLRGQLFPAGRLRRDQRRTRPRIREAARPSRRPGRHPAQPVLQGAHAGAAPAALLLRQAGCYLGCRNRQAMRDLKATLVQGMLQWEDAAANRAAFAAKLEPLRGATDLIVLPEMF